MRLACLVLCLIILAGIGMADCLPAAAQPQQAQGYTLNHQEQLSGWLTQPWVRGLLLSIMFFAFMLEIKTAGLGIGALLSAIAAVLFFGGQMASGSLGWEVPALFVIGIVLIAIELAVPGGVLAGIAGVAAIFTSLFIALGADSFAAGSLLAAIFGAGLIFMLLAKYFPTSKLWDKLVLKTAETTAKGFVSTDDYQQYLGKTGKAITLLRPAGTAEIEGVRLDVVSEGLFVNPGEEIIVFKVEGNRIVVRTKEKQEVL